MADHSVSERLQPSLLDRLTDDKPRERKETRADRVIDLRRLREIIQRDLTWLLNAANLEGQVNLDGFPNVRRSTVNYGMRSTSGDFTTDERVERIRRAIAEAIEVFEPRVVRGTAEVELRPDLAKGEMYVALDIRAAMWAQPLPMELYLRSRVDLTTGDVEVERSG